MTLFVIYWKFPQYAPIRPINGLLKGIVMQCQGGGLQFSLFHLIEYSERLQFIWQWKITYVLGK